MIAVRSAPPGRVDRSPTGHQYRQETFWSTRREIDLSKSDLSRRLLRVGEKGSRCVLANAIWRLGDLIGPHIFGPQAQPFI